MATANWAALSTEGSNIASTALDSLADGSRSTGLTHDNSSALHLRAQVRVNLGSITPGTNGYVTLEEYLSIGGNVEDFGGTPYAAQTKLLTTTASAKVVIFDVPLAPNSVRFVLLNKSGVALAASGNALRVTTYDETVA
jgi:hypothetical protein